MKVETHQFSATAPSSWRTSVQRRPAQGAEADPRMRPGWFAGASEYAAARVGLAASALGLALTVLLGAAAPNANSVAIRGPLAVLPPLPSIMSNGVSWASTVLAGLGLSALLVAHVRGWRPEPGRLMMMGSGVVAILVNLTPVGSSDIASYAAYGRLWTLGLDPYQNSPAALGSPYAPVVADQWIGTPSVYGPFATFIQAAGALIGTSHPAVTIWVLMVANGAAFLLVGWMLTRIARDPARAALLWTANPLLIQQLVGGGHLDTFVVAAAVAAVFVASRVPAAGVPDGGLSSRWLRSGALVGVACGVKANGALVGAGLAWERLRERDYRGLVRIAAAGGAVLAGGYLLVGRDALRPLFEASGMVGAASPWSLFAAVLTYVVGPDAGGAVAHFGWPFAMVAAAVMLFRLLPVDEPRVLRTQLALSFAWVLMAPWVMPWYAALAWGFHAQLAPNRLTRWLIVYTVIQACLHNSGGWSTGYTT
jgi:glycosyl transferase family 87